MQFDIASSSSAAAVPIADALLLQSWTVEWLRLSLARGAVELPYRPDDEVVVRLRDYFRAGLTPSEAVHCCFGELH